MNTREIAYIKGFINDKHLLRNQKDLLIEKEQKSIMAKYDIKEKVHA